MLGRYNVSLSLGMKTLLLICLDVCLTTTVQKCFRFIDSSDKPYNLRSKNKHVLTCYQKEGKICPYLDPVVVIKERVPDSSTKAHGYLVTKNNKIIVKKIVNNKEINDSRKLDMILLTCLCMITFLSFLYYYEVGIQHNFISKIRDVTLMNTYIGNETSDTCEIRDLVLSALDKLKDEEEEEDDDEMKEERAMSFIQEQCLSPENDTDLEDSVTSVNDIFDRENLTDYALEAKGASIVTVFDTKPYGFISLKFWGLEFASGLSYLYQKYFHSKAPYRILMPWSKPGDCWAFKGSYGRVKIELWDKIKISAISIDHIRKENFSVEDISSAPKTISVAASENENSSTIFLGSFEYKITGPSVQTFPISPVIMENPFRFVEITITSNHGNQHYTCLYRVRVHGRK